MANRLVELFFISVLTLFALGVHGYHPYAEDGGLYVTGIKHLLDPSIYPAYTPFVTEHLRFSLFAPFTAALVRFTHLGLPWSLFVLYTLSVWLTLFSASRLAAHLTPSTPVRAGAVTLLACWLTLPIAGTALILFDPYLTARSFSTPLCLFALTAALDLIYVANHHLRNLLLCATSLLLATLLHPLMAGYALIAIVFLHAVSQASPFRRFVACAGIVSVAVLTACMLQLLVPPESPAYLEVVLTRYYWFPFWWHWYEQLGLVAPPILLVSLARHTPGTPVRQAVSRTAVAITLAAILLAALFSRVHTATHLVASLQPLRIMQLVYVLMILLLGIWLGEQIPHTRFRRRSISLATLTVAILASIMFYVQRRTFPGSPELELPTTSISNPWVQAFLWIRHNTPVDAVFALDAHYITVPGEDAQHFRAIAERSVLPDYSKDGGEASITPGLTPVWTVASRATLNLNAQSDNARLVTLRPLDVTWIVLGSRAATRFPCPYLNTTVKVCRLR